MYTIEYVWTYCLLANMSSMTFLLKCDDVEYTPEIEA